MDARINGRLDSVDGMPAQGIVKSRQMQPCVGKVDTMDEGNILLPVGAGLVAGDKVLDTDAVFGEKTGGVSRSAVFFSCHIKMGFSRNWGVFSPSECFLGRACPSPASGNSLFRVPTGWRSIDE